MEFFSPADDSACSRDESGQINAVITPIDRNEPLRKQWTLEEFDKAVYNSDDSSLDRLHRPGVVAWEYVKRYLQPKDEIWTFGILDTGLVVIREGKVFCMIVVDHQL